MARVGLLALRHEARPHEGGVQEVEEERPAGDEGPRDALEHARVVGAVVEVRKRREEGGRRVELHRERQVTHVPPHVRRRAGQPRRLLAGLLEEVVGEVHARHAAPERGERARIPALAAREV